MRERERGAGARNQASRKKGRRQIALGAWMKSDKTTEMKNAGEIKKEKKIKKTGKTKDTKKERKKDKVKGVSRQLT